MRRDRPPDVAQFGSQPAPTPFSATATARYVDLVLQFADQSTASSAAFRTQNFGRRRVPVHFLGAANWRRCRLAPIRSALGSTGRCTARRHTSASSTRPSLPSNVAADSCDDVTGTWAGSAVTVTLAQSGNAITSGSNAIPVVTLEDGSTCQANTYHTANGSFSPQNGNFSVNFSNPDYTARPSSNGLDDCIYPESFSYQNGTLRGAGCESASGDTTNPKGTFYWTRTATLPDGETSSFRKRMGHVMGLAYSRVIHSDADIEGRAGFRR